MALTNPKNLTFTTCRSKPILVKPTMPTPHEFKSLSDVDDQEGLRFYQNGVIFYPKNHFMLGQDPAQIIKLALEKVLVYYCPFAGRIREGPGRASTRRKQFVIAFRELARGANSPSVQPVWAREILSARVPPHITHKHPEYDYTSERYSLPMDSLVHRSFFFGHKELSVLKEQASAKSHRFVTKFELIVACLWKCRTIAMGYNPGEKVRLMFVVDARGKGGLKIPKGFYGTALAFPVAEAEAGKLCQQQLNYALQLVREAKARPTADGYMQSVADLLVSKGRPHVAIDSRTYVVSEITNAGLERIDFGWEKGVYAGPETVSLASYCIGMQNSNGEKGIRVSMHLPESTMERFCQEMEKITNASNVCAPSFERHTVSRL